MGRADGKGMKPVRFGEYELHGRVSHGGMAEVFRATTSGAAGFERTVAIKVLLPTIAMDDGFVTMLIDEAKIAGLLTHANIAQIFDLGKVDDRYYIVQEFVNGKDLRAMQKAMALDGRAFDVKQSSHIAIKVCEALEYAHTKCDPNGNPVELVHRDISPQNIMVSREGEIKLVDFGIAKAEGRSTRTLAGLVKGKFAYMSPEQLRGLPVDRRSDVFACGIVLWELLTGKALFRRSSEFETLKRARSAEIEPPSKYNNSVSKELDAAVLKALTRHVDDRFQTAIDFRDALWSAMRAEKGFYARADLATWMRDNFPEEQPFGEDHPIHDDNTLPSDVTTMRDLSDGPNTTDEMDVTFFDPTIGQQMEAAASPASLSADTSINTLDFSITGEPVSLFNITIPPEDVGTAPPHRRTAPMPSTSAPAAIHARETEIKNAVFPAPLAQNSSGDYRTTEHDIPTPLGSGAFEPGESAMALIEDAKSETNLHFEGTAQVDWKKRDAKFTYLNTWTLAAAVVFVIAGATSLTLVLFS